MTEELERHEGEDPLLVHANSVPGTGDSEFGDFVRENMRELLREAVRTVKEEKAE
jgi:hypothetical protein